MTLTWAHLGSPCTARAKVGRGKCGLPRSLAPAVHGPGTMGLHPADHPEAPAGAWACPDGHMDWIRTEEVIMTGLNPTPNNVRRDAEIDSTGVYRYSLERQWAGPQSADFPNGWACFVLLNPSTADAADEDNTSRRCIGFAQSWGCWGLEVVNLFAWRSKDPNALAVANDRSDDVVGFLNNSKIALAAIFADASGGPVVVGWGFRGANYPQRVGEVLHLLQPLVPEVRCLGTTKGGDPRHPLYLPQTAALVPLDAAPLIERGASRRQQPTPQEASRGIE